MFDFTDHTLTTISTWAEVAILLFMFYEHYGPRIRGWLMGAKGADPAIVPAETRAKAIWRSLWANRTLIVALIGLAIVLWLNFGRAQVSREEAEAQKRTLMTWLQQAQNEGDSARRDAGRIRQQLQDKDTQLSDANNKLADAQNALAEEKAKHPFYDFSTDNSVLLGHNANPIFGLSSPLGETKPIENAVAWAQFSYSGGTLSLTSRSSVINNVKIEEEKGSVSGNSIPIFYVEFTFNEDVGPATIKIEKPNYLGLGSLSAASTFDYNYDYVMDKPAKSAKISIDLSNTSAYLLLNGVTVSFYKKGT